MLDTLHDGSDDSRWLTYGEVAEVCGISKAFAIRLSRRDRWPRQRDKQGGVRVLVPLEWFDKSHGPPENSHEVARIAACFEAALAALREASAPHIAELQRRLLAAEQGRDQWRAFADAAVAEADRLRQTEVERRSMTRWKRLRVAWRG